MKPARAQLLELLRIVAATDPRELNCEEFLARVGAYLEGLEQGSAPPPELSQVSRHLEVCPECHEEFEALVEVYHQA